MNRQEAEALAQHITSAHPRLRAEIRFQSLYQRVDEHEVLLSIADSTWNMCIFSLKQWEDFCAIFLHALPALLPEHFPEKVQS